MNYKSLSFEELKKLCIDRHIPIEFIDQNKKSFIQILKRYDQFDKIIQKNGYDKLNLLELRLVMVEKDIYVSGLSNQQILYHIASSDFAKQERKKREGRLKNKKYNDNNTNNNKDQITKPPEQKKNVKTTRNKTIRKTYRNEKQK